MATGRLIGKPSALRELCDAAAIGSRPAWTLMSQKVGISNGGAEQHRRMVQPISRGRFKCPCRFRRHFQRKHVIWGSVELSLETAGEQHFSNCPASQDTSARHQSREISLTYTGLRRLLKSAVKVSFMLTSGAGGGSFGATLIHYPTVDWRRAPVFRILSLLNVASYGRSMPHFWDKLLPPALSTIWVLFRDERASPRAVDVNNQSLVHYLAGCVSRWNDVRTGTTD